jgi:hypothetical protein
MGVDDVGPAALEQPPQPVERRGVLAGEIGRTSSSTTVTSIPRRRASSSSEPSRPVGGPVIRRMSKRSRSAWQERIVFSCAPPAMSRVMTL